MCLADLIYLRVAAHQSGKILAPGTYDKVEEVSTTSFSLANWRSKFPSRPIEKRNLTRWVLLLVVSGYYLLVYIKCVD
jgi:hypothetical protein